MTVNPLPPQAYTKETLQKAYTWLLNQSPSVKDLATTQDMLVSLYLRAVRNGEANIDTPSIQNFKQELKSLASLMGDLQTPGSAQIAAPAMPSAPIPMQAQAAPKSMPAAAASVVAQLDEKSQMAMQEVKLMLNLSSDIEALRALISLGYKQFKKI